MGQQRSCGGPSAWSCRNICRVSLTQVQKRTTTSSPQDQKAMSPRMVPYQQKNNTEVCIQSWHPDLPHSWRPTLKHMNFHKISTRIPRISSSKFVVKSFDDFRIMPTAHWPSTITAFSWSLQNNDNEIWAQNSHWDHRQFHCDLCQGNGPAASQYGHI